jgi:general secretion pathway protein G
MNHNLSNSTRNREARTDSAVRHRSDGGFTLIELLIVVAILGVLATVVVFAVRGVKDRGTDSAQSIDERTIVTAQEAYQAQHGSYADETTLVGARMLRNESDLHDITIEADGSYTLAYVGPSGGGAATTIPGPPPVMPPTVAQYAGLGALRYGNGPTEYVLLTQGDGALAADWGAYTSASCDPGTSVLFLITDPGVTPADVDTIASEPGFHAFIANTGAGTAVSIHINIRLYMVLDWGSAPLQDFFGSC